MAIWKLTPISTDPEEWRLSSYRGSVTVRASSEAEAREVAWGKFLQAEKHQPGRTTPLSPWKNGSVVSCERVSGSRFPQDGPAEVLDPA